MTQKLFIALYVGLFVGMFVLMFANFPVGWIFFAFVFVAVFGGFWMINRPALIATGFLLVSLLVLGIGLIGMGRSWQVNTWPTAGGEITRSWFCTRTTNGEVTYSGPCIEYSYSVNGQEFEVSSIDTHEFDQQVWFNIPEKFKQGRELEVHYDPNAPAVSRLTTEFLPRDWITALVGGIMAVLSAFTLLYSTWHKKESSPINTLRGLERKQLARALGRVIPTQVSGEKSIPDIADQLEKLAELRENQDLTDEEYELAKKRLLGIR